MHCVCPLFNVLCKQGSERKPGFQRTKRNLQICEEQTYVWAETTADLCREQTHTDVWTIQAEGARAQPQTVAVVVRKPATT